MKTYEIFCELMDQIYFEGFVGIADPALVAFEWNLFLEMF